MMSFHISKFDSSVRMALRTVLKIVGLTQIHQERVIQWCIYHAEKQRSSDSFYIWRGKDKRGGVA